MAGLRGLLPVLLVLGVVFGPDAYKVFSNIGTPAVKVRNVYRAALRLCIVEELQAGGRCCLAAAAQCCLAAKPLPSFVNVFVLITC